MIPRLAMRTELDRADLPTGTVTFMFTDIEGSTRIVQDVGDDRFREIVEGHQRLIETTVVRFGGVKVGSEGDSVFAVFPDAVAATAAALRIHEELDADAAGLKVRIGLHTGNGVLGGDNYIGVDVHRAARISSSAHGGQTVVSDVTARLVDGRLGEGAQLTSLGRYQLAGFSQPTTLHQVTAKSEPRRFPPLRAAVAESRIPTALTDFVGRDQEIETGRRILEEHRLLTLTGPGGTGKTRLAIEIARRVEERFADGAYFVPLAPIVDSDLIPMTILETMGLETAGGVDPFEHLTLFLARRSVLLVLDNYEQLLDGASFVASLLDEASDLTIIVTSRSPLRLRGERELPVPPLEVPPDIGDLAGALAANSVRLFVSRAEAVRPDFTLDTGNVETVSAIARALDGLPLAIELAASRIRSLTPDALLDRLGNQLLATPSSDVPERQQTIANTIGWSYDLLDEDTKRLFEQLSVFSGTFGIEEAEAVYEGVLDTIDGLTDLVEQSLLRQTAASGSPRFRMLTVIREFAFVALTSREADSGSLDRHAAVYLDIAERADVEILTSRQGHWLARLSEDHDNLRAAFDHSVATDDAETALRLVGSLWRFWQMRGHLVEARRRIETALAMGGQDDSLPRARALTGLGGIRYWQGEWKDNLEPYQRALEIFRRHGADEEVAEALYNLSFPIGYSGDLDRAETLLQESLEISRRTGHLIGVGRAHWAMGDMASFRKDWSSTIRHMESAIEVFSDVDAPFDLGWSWFMLAFSRVKMHDPDEARAPLLRALEIFSTARDMSALALILDVAGIVMIGGGSSQDAAYFIGAAHHIKADTGVAITEVDVNQYPEVDQFMKEMGPTERVIYDEGYHAGLDMVLEKARAALTSQSPVSGTPS